MIVMHYAMTAAKVEKQNQWSKSGAASGQVRSKSEAITVSWSSVNKGW